MVSALAICAKLMNHYASQPLQVLSSTEDI